MIKQGKRMLVMLLALLLVFSLAACSSSQPTSGGTDKGSNQGSSDSSKSDKKEPVTLKVLTHYTAANADAINPYIDQWNKENPDIQVVLESVEFSELLPTIMTKQTSGQIADINHIYSL